MFSNVDWSLAGQVVTLIVMAVAIALFVSEGLGDDEGAQ